MVDQEGSSRSHQKCRSGIYFEGRANRICRETLGACVCACARCVDGRVDGWMDGYTGDRQRQIADRQTDGKAPKRPREREREEGRDLQSLGRV